MSRRPLSVTIIGWMFILAGSVGFLYHASDITLHQLEPLLLGAIRILAILCGVFVLRGFNWARRLLLVWIAYHVVLSAFHSAGEFAAHGVLLAAVAYFLFRPNASAYFSECIHNKSQRTLH